jgi:hypothetical protein
MDQGIDCIDNIHKKRRRPAYPDNSNTTSDAIKISVYLDETGIISKDGPESYFVFGVDARQVVGSLYSALSWIVSGWHVS